MAKAKSDRENEASEHELVTMARGLAEIAAAHNLSELIVDIDIFLEVDPGPGEDDAAAVRAEVERLLAPPPGLAIAAADAAPEAAGEPAPGSPVVAAGAGEALPQSAPGEDFGTRYWPYVHDDPKVAMAHGEVKQALRRLPDPREVDEAAVLHARHLFREARSHR